MGVAQPLPGAKLRPETQQAFDAYTRQREGFIQWTRVQGGKFLWADEDASRQGRVKNGEVVIEPGAGAGTVEVLGGLVHDWIGAAFIPCATMAQVVARVQDYDSHKRIYRPEVVDSSTVQRNGNNFRLRYRLLKKKVITVVLNTDHEVNYFPIDSTRQHSRSRTTRVAEVSNPGEAGEQELTPGDDHGLLWQLNTFWRFLERDGGVWVECEALSLSRGIPLGLGWMITPIVGELPRESLTLTLEGTRRAAR
ncbi:MAG: hypothetical protein FJW31_06630 [Acidobacteria bacterium]|nr:hypothetical protein [Acidobacteriota bacterium]